MKKTVLLGLLSVFCSKETLGARTFDWNYWSFKQCTPELAQDQYRAYFEKTNSTDVNNGGKFLQGQWYSSLVEKCVRNSNITTIKSFMAHLLLKHIMDARIAADGLGTEASMSSNSAQAEASADILAAAQEGGESMAKAADEQVNKRRPNFDTMYKRMIFFRYGILSRKTVLQEANLLDAEGKKTKNYNKKNVKDAFEKKTNDIKGKLKALYEEGKIENISPYDLEVVLGKFGWEDIKRVLPDVAKELEDTLERMHQIKKSLDAYQFYKLSPSKTARAFLPPLPSAIPSLVFPIAQITE